MNLIYFIRLLFKNLLLIFGVAIGMAVAVYVLTRHEQKTYSASTTVYTGIATGYDIESGINARFDLFSNNAQFDNLINIIKSRETHEQTAIMLMAQHLVLPKPDIRYCLPSTWREVQAAFPSDIRRLAETTMWATDRSLSETRRPEPPATDTASVDNKATATPDSAVTIRPDTIRVEKIRYTKKYYVIRAGDNPNLVAQKYGLTPERLKELNRPMPPFNGGQRLVVGLKPEAYTEDSIVAKEVKSAPASGFTEMVQDSSVRQMRPGEVENQKTAGSGISEIMAPEYVGTYLPLVRKLNEYKNADQQNYIFQTLQSANPYYSVQKISSVKVTRIQSSDLLKLSFDSNDPGICVQTLRIITDVFKNAYQSITKTQTGLVSDYYRQRVNEARRHLDSLEQSLLKFRMDNRIINYDEQTKFVSEQKETLDRDWYEAAGLVAAARTALGLVERNLADKDKTIVQNTDLLARRKRVYDLAMRISMAEIRETTDNQLIDVDSLSALKGQLASEKLALNDDLMRLFAFNRTVQGLNVQNVLTTWLEKAIQVEESEARYTTLTKRKTDFMKKYDEFAPLGSTLKKIEREIDLAQQEYMNHLFNLNQSIMKQKNVEQSDIQVIDAPVYPVKPNPSKRMMTVIAAFMAGLILTAALIILLEFLDSSIKFPSRLEELSGLKLLGAFPRLPAKPDGKMDYPLISSRSIDQIAQRIYLEELRNRQNIDQPFILFMVSTRENEGKSFLAGLIVEKMRTSGSRVLYIKPLEKTQPKDLRTQFTRFDEPPKPWDYEYALPDNFIGVKNINELLRNYTFLTRGYQFIVIELPALLHQEYPAGLVEKGSFSILTALATRAWNPADTETVALYRNIAGHPVMALLNACQPDQLETIIGEIPKRRSFLRKLVKKLIHFDFKTHEID